MNSSFHKTLFVLLLATQSISKVAAMEQQTDIFESTDTKDNEIAFRKSQLALENILECENIFCTFLNTVQMKEETLNGFRSYQAHATSVRAEVCDSPSGIFTHLGYVLQWLKNQVFLQEGYGFESKENYCAIAKIALIEKWYESNNNQLPEIKLPAKTLDTKTVTLDPTNPDDSLVFSKANAALEDMKKCQDFLTDFLETTELPETHIKELRTFQIGLQYKIDFFKIRPLEMFPYSDTIVNELLQLGLFQEKYNFKSKENYCAIGRLVIFSNLLNVLETVHGNDEPANNETKEKEKELDSDKPVNKGFLDS